MKTDKLLANSKFKALQALLAKSKPTGGEMNVRLLRRIAKVIQEKPKEFDMCSWHRDNTRTFGGALALCELPKDRQISCKTTHCIAGWAQALSPKRDCKVSAATDAARLLGLTEEEGIRLFYVTYDDEDICSAWPKRFHGRKDKWHPTAKQAAARIEHFIKTKGAE